MSCSRAVNRERRRLSTIGRDISANLQPGTGANTNHEPYKLGDQQQSHLHQLYHGDWEAADWRRRKIIPRLIIPALHAWSGFYPLREDPSWWSACTRFSSLLFSSERKHVPDYSPTCITLFTSLVPFIHPIVQFRSFFLVLTLVWLINSPMNIIYVGHFGFLSLFALIEEFSNC